MEQHQHSPSLSMTTPKPSPRPIPQFFNDQFNHLATKRERYSSTPKTIQLPPRPPSKSFQQYRLSFTLNNSINQHNSNNNNSNHHHYHQQKAQIISFKNEQRKPQLSPLYNHDLKESYLKQCYHVEERIGSGSFGDVFRCRNRHDHKYYAIKISREKFKGKIDREEKLNEVCKHEQLPDHDHLVKLHCAWEEKQRLYIETELCAGTLSMLAENNHELPESTIWAILVDLLKAIDHLHSNNLIHLDIKPENIFISRDGICKLGDFGLIFDTNNHKLKEATEGDPKYLAGEVMQGIFTKSADIFSLGMTMLEITCDLDLPSRGDAWHWLRNGAIPNHLFKNRSEGLKNIIKMMLDPYHEKRPSAKELLNHSLIQLHEQKRRKELITRKIRSKLSETIEMIDSICMEQTILAKLWSYIKQMITMLSSPFYYLWYFQPKQQQKQNCDMILESLTLNQSNNLNSNNSTQQQQQPNYYHSPNYNRTYVSNYLDQYSDLDDDDDLDNQSKFLSTFSFIDPNSSSDDEFAYHHHHSFQNNNLCSTVNRHSSSSAFNNNFIELKTPKLSPLNHNHNDDNCIIDDNLQQQQSSPMFKSVIQRLTFDEFSSDEMEMSENDEDNDDNLDVDDLTDNNNCKTAAASICNLRFNLRNAANISRKNLMKSFDEIDEMVS